MLFGENDSLHFTVYILSDFPGIKNLNGLNNLNSLSAQLSTSVLRGGTKVQKW